MKKLNLALNHLCQKVGGEWMLLGGSLIAYDVDSTRGTEDIDLVRIDAQSPAQKVELMQEMLKLGISVEQFNSSVDFYVNQIANWKEHKVLLSSGARGKIFRPSLSLFAILKLRRGTPLDLEDVKLAAKKWGREEFNKESFFSWASVKEIALAQSIGLL